MKERPILFSGPMVRAILDGRKTQTRRIVKPQPLADTTKVYPIKNKDFSATTGWWVCECLREGRRWTDNREFLCPYGKPGDRLWVREAWKPGSIKAGGVPRLGIAWSESVIWREGYPDQAGPWKPSIFMPRWASRITLEITGVRVERLQDISEEDARAEGVAFRPAGSVPPPDSRQLVQPDGAPYRFSFSLLWDMINGPGNWDENPWVWVVEFKRLEVAQ